MRALFLTKYGLKGASSRYRALQFFPHLAARGWDIEWQPLFPDSYLETLYRTGQRRLSTVAGAYLRRLAFLLHADLRCFEVVFLQAEVFRWLPYACEAPLLAGCRNLVIDFDDAAFIPYAGRPLLEDKFEKLVRGARGVIAGNEYLREWASRFNANVTLIPTVVDVSRYRVKEDYEARDPKGFVFGWVGTPITARYLATLSGTLRRLSAQRRILVRAVGTAPGFSIPGVAVENLPWSEENEADLIRTFDAGVMPLAAEDFALGKCGLKLIQYMAAGVPAVGSRAGANGAILRDGIDGFLASSDDEYCTVLSRLIEDRAVRESVGRAGRRTVEERYSLERAAGEFCAVFERLAPERGPVPAHHRSVKLLRATTSPLALAWFFRRLTPYLQEHGIDTVAVSSPGRLLEEFRAETGAPVHAVPMERRITPLADLPALLRLWRIMRRERPDIVHAHTPKAGLLGMIAAWLARVPVRMYTIHGLPLMTREGWRFHLLRLADKTACRLATDTYCVSHSVRQVALDLAIAPANKLRTLGFGSCAGVNLAEFDPALHGAEDRTRVREQYGIPASALVAGFIGRLVRDKGIIELAEAWQRLREEFPHLHLLCCGDFEDQDPVPAAIRDALQRDPRVHLTGGFIEDMPPVYAALDVCLLPTYREGLPTVALECAAMQVPLVATRVPGCTDAVRDGVTGVLVEPRSSSELAAAVARLLRNSALRRELGRAARKFVAARFGEEFTFSLLLAEYRRVLALDAGPYSRGRGSPVTEWMRPASNRTAEIMSAPAFGRKAGRVAAVMERATELSKRAVDIVGAAAGLALAAPVMAAVAAAVRMRLGSPVIFSQERAGRGGRPFLLYKFRTMTDARDAAGNLLPDEQRLTPLGWFLRRMSLDELPQLWNVLKGEMSLVGPRPFHAEYVARYTAQQARRLEVKPGITGWAQIHGRNLLDWEQKFELDLWYILHRSLWLDVGILAATVWCVIRGDGISHAGHATMPEFLGQRTEQA